MRVPILCLVLLTSASVGQAQRIQYKLTKLYNFETKTGKNPMEEFANNNEKKLTGGVSEKGKEIVITLDEDHGIISSFNHYREKGKELTKYKIISKHKPTTSYTSYLVELNNNYSAFIFSIQSQSTINIYHFYKTQHGLNRGWQSVVHLDN